MSPYRVLLLLLVLAALIPSTAQADTPAGLSVVIPATVTITPNQSKIVFIGRPAGDPTTVGCEPGTFPVQSAVVIDPGGGTASQITTIVPLHDHEIQNGTRYVILDSGENCGFAPDGTLLKRYQTQLD